MDIFDSCLSPKLRHMTRYLYKGADKIAFEHVFSILEQRNGQRASQQGRFVWENVSLPLQGRVTLSDLRVFRIDFLDAQRGVPDVGEGEARRHLMARLPNFLGERIFKKEMERSRTSKKVHINPGQVVPPSEMRGFVRDWARVAPLELESKGDGSFEVLMPSEESVERLLAYNCHEIEGSDHVLQVRKMPVQFSVVDIFDLLEEQLGEAEDLEAAFPRGGVRARVVASESPRQVDSQPPRIGPGGVYLSDGNPPPVTCPLLFNVGGVEVMGINIRSVRMSLASGQKARARARAMAAAAHAARALQGGVVGQPLLPPAGPLHRPRRALHRQWGGILLLECAALGGPGGL